MTYDEKHAPVTGIPRTAALDDAVNSHDLRRAADAAAAIPARRGEAFVDTIGRSGTPGVVMKVAQVTANQSGDGMIGSLCRSLNRRTRTGRAFVAVNAGATGVSLRATPDMKAMDDAALLVENGSRA